MKKLTVMLLISVIIATSKLVIALPVPPEIKKVVSFIFLLDKDGRFIPQGTGFFVGVKNPQLANTYFVYLVTAKHVLMAKDKKSWLPAVYIRLNKKETGADILRIDLTTSGAGKNVFVHDDSSVDLAVIRTVPDQEKYDFKFIQEELLTTKTDYQSLRITEGSEVFFTGLFIPYIGDQRNYPIVRFGRVALVTDERISFGDTKAELYLMEANAYGGNSGSPVFFHLGAERNPGVLTVGPPVIKLAGVISGRFNDIIPVQIAQTDAVPVVSPNLGIVGVVPAYKLSEILLSPELKNLRNPPQLAPQRKQ